MCLDHTPKLASSLFEKSKKEKKEKNFRTREKDGVCATGSRAIFFCRTQNVRAGV